MMKTAMILSLLLALILQSCKPLPRNYRRGSETQEDSKNAIYILKAKTMYANIDVSCKTVDATTHNIENKIN